MKSILFLIGFLPGLVFADGIATIAEVKKQVEKYELDCADELSVQRIDYENLVYFVTGCRTGAYNRYGVLFVDSKFAPLEAVPLSSPFLGLGDKIVGWGAEIVAPALEYDAATQTLTSENKGGVADRLFATYEIRNGYVILRKYSRYSSKDGDDFAETVIFEGKDE